MKHLRVFHGLSEVAGQGCYSAKGLKELGVKVKLVVWEPNSFRYEYDISLNIDRNKKYMFPFWILKLLFYELKILKENDVFHFHFGRSLFLNYDLWLLGKLRKKVFYEFHGSDLRDYPQARKLNPYIFCEGNDKTAVYLRKRAEKICRYADGVILHDDELIPYLPANASHVYIVPLRLDLEKIKPVYVSKESQKVRIVHAPTERDIKGSAYVIEAVRLLEKEYDVELVLVENKTREEALELYKTADIIVDQLRIGTYGVFAIEGMAMGKPVVTYLTDEMQQRFPEELPICSANPDTVKDVLEKLIKDGKLRYDLGVRGRQYAEKYHDYRKNAQMLYDIYCGKIGSIQGREAFAYAAQKRLKD